MSLHFSEWGSCVVQTPSRSPTGLSVETSTKLDDGTRYPLHHLPVRTGYLWRLQCAGSTSRLFTVVGGVDSGPHYGTVGGR